jgi:hypothetical protein
VAEVALISGRRNPRTLSRYTHLRPEKVAEKLARPFFSEVDPVHREKSAAEPKKRAASMSMETALRLQPANAR